MKIKLLEEIHQASDDISSDRPDRTRRILDKNTLYGLNRNCKWTREITTLEDMRTKITK